jgi:hypothetical protein
VRSFLGWVVLVAVFAAIAYLLAPVIARPLVADAVRAASPFGSEPLDVDVDADTLGLLRGTITSIHVTGTSLTETRLDVARLDVTVRDVGVLDRTFASLDGTLESVVLRRDDGAEMKAREVRLSGASDAVLATARAGREATLDLVGRALRGAGLPADGLELIDGGVRMSLLGQQTDVALGASDGALTIAGSIGGGGSIVVFGPEAGDPWRITGVSVSADGLEVHAVIDLGAVLRGG